MPGGTILRVETKERECWKFLDQRLISENDSRFHGQPSNAGIHSIFAQHWVDRKARIAEINFWSTSNIHGPATKS